LQTSRLETCDSDSFGNRVEGQVPNDLKWRNRPEAAISAHGGRHSQGEANCGLLVLSFDARRSRTLKCDAESPADSSAASTSGARCLLGSRVDASRLPKR